MVRISEYPSILHRDGNIQEESHGCHDGVGESHASHELLCNYAAVVLHMHGNYECISTDREPIS